MSFFLNRFINNTVSVMRIHQENSSEEIMESKRAWLKAIEEEEKENEARYREIDPDRTCLLYTSRCV